ncbi:hypothetical protein AGABI1DRAFT_104558, partial [Agaricus bisporus var. burnettii JB137-S8]
MAPNYTHSSCPAPPPVSMNIHVDTPQFKYSFTLSDTSLIVNDGESPQLAVPHHWVLASRYDEEEQLMHVSYLIEKIDRRKGTSLMLVNVKGSVEDRTRAFEWSEELMGTVYDGYGIQRSRRLRVLVNPHGGVKKRLPCFPTSSNLYFVPRGVSSISPVDTTHHGHAHDIAKDLATNYDAVVAVSGDGLVHEVLNGFAEHADPIKAFSIPVAPIPTGSGNGLSLNLLGEKDGFDVTKAALNVVKGQPMKVDLFSFTQDDERSISFMSQSLGLMADLDVGTEHLRWMGDTRFIVGMLRGLIQFKACPVQISYKAAEKDKRKMAESASAHRNAVAKDTSASAAEGDTAETLPPLRFQPGSSGEGWTTIDEPLLYVYAGKGPFVGRDYMAFPVSLPDDGLIDVVTVPLSSRKDVVVGMVGASKGDSYWSPKLHYVKAHAYRVKPLKKKGSLAVDGELYPFKEFQVESISVPLLRGTIRLYFNPTTIRVMIDCVGINVRIKHVALLVLCRTSLMVTHTPSSHKYHSDALDKWMKNPPTVTLSESLHYDKLSDLYITLPTRDGTRRPYVEPKVGDPAIYGVQFASFHSRQAEHLLRKDGTDNDISPPAPFLRRMWAGGKITWDNSNPLLIGSKTYSQGSVAEVTMKGADKGKPMLFLTQKINYEMEAMRGKPSVVEERAHVYFEVKEDEHEGTKPPPKPVKGIPSSVDFSLAYVPSVVTLFRFSALMFNAHHIHLDKEYSQKKEGYQERLVHGPLTALMLLETAVFNKPDIRIKSFEYRATNPMIVDRKATVN